MPQFKNTLHSRFLSKVQKLPYDGCWIWTARKTPKGYGYLAAFYCSKIQNYISQPAHRIAYQLYVGQIPNGFHVDHLCRNPSCVNPCHLEAVTCKENVRRGLRSALKTQCPKGHPWIPENQHMERNGRRRCKICRVMYSKQQHERKMLKTVLSEKFHY